MLVVLMFLIVGGIIMFLREKRNKSIEQNTSILISVLKDNSNKEEELINQTNRLAYTAIYEKNPFEKIYLFLESGLPTNVRIKYLRIVEDGKLIFAIGSASTLELGTVPSGRSLGVSEVNINRSFQLLIKVGLNNEVQYLMNDFEDIYDKNFQFDLVYKIHESVSI